MFTVDPFLRILSSFTPSVWYVLIVCFTLVLLACLAFLLSRRGEKIMTRIIKAVELYYRHSRKSSHRHRDRHEHIAEVLLYECCPTPQAERHRRSRKKQQRRRYHRRRNSYRRRQARRRMHGPRLLRK